uniref:Alpha/beta hydrolase n=1 Tax=Pithovirus LCPAC304 TaxID=2506594 RepID=A0A481ZAI0_9VIRU|nr:MAG: hypothetical protein LCPAC304_05170 [Pithovirus LCPAC304]
METNKEIALRIISEYEREYKSTKYVLIDNHSKTTNVIFTGASQKYYNMISWYHTYTDYNWLYLNPICEASEPHFVLFMMTNGQMKGQRTYDDLFLEIIKSAPGDMYNLIGISYGGAAAIAFSKRVPTRAVITLDYANIFNYVDWDLPDILQDNTSLFFLHYSSHPHDIARHDVLIKCLQKTKIQYMLKCSQCDIHSTNVPNHHLIVSYIKAAERITSDECDVVMKNVTYLGGDFHAWT